MTERYVLNASALLCLLDDKPGAERVAEVLDHTAVTAVTVAVVAAEMMQRGVGREESSTLLASLHLQVLEIGFDRAISAGAIGSRYTDSQAIEHWCWLAAANDVAAVAMTAAAVTIEGTDQAEVEVIGPSAACHKLILHSTHFRRKMGMAQNLRST